MIDQFSSPDNNFSSGNFFGFILRYWKSLVIIIILSIVFATIFSSPYFIPPKFESTVVMFPTSSNSISKTLLSDKAGDGDIMEFGNEEQAEQLLQILKSSRIRDLIINKFMLSQHYDISPTDNEKRYKTSKIFKENIKFRRTEYGAVEISVLDTDPKLAASIANTISDQFDSIKNSMHQERAIEAFLIVKTEFHLLQAYIHKMEDSLTAIRQKGVVDYESQSEMLNRQLAIELAKGNQKAIDRLNKKIEIIAKYGGAYVSIRDELIHEKNQLSLIKAKYDEAKVDATQNLPQKFIVDKAYPAEKKSYPIRWLIIISVVFSALLLSILLLTIKEKAQRYHQQK